MMRVSKFLLMALTIASASSMGVAYQGTPLSGATVTFVSAGTVYVNRGTSSGVGLGDTLLIRHAKQNPVRVLVNAVSSASCSALFSASLGQVAPGDSVTISTVNATPQVTRPPAASVDSQSSMTAKLNRTAPLPVPTGTRPSVSTINDPAIHGRVGIQYSGAGVLWKAMDISEPSLLLQLTATHLLDGGFSFSMYSRSSRDVSAGFSRWGINSRTRVRLYEMTLGYRDGSSFGMDVGRLISQYAGGLGQLDGAQVFVKTGPMTIGVLGGTQPDYTTSGFDFSQQRGAAFVNLAVDETDFMNRKSLTLAYGRQLHQGKFDRDFLYTQANAQFGSSVSFYENAEIDLHTLQNGVSTNGFSLTNSYLSLTYLPVDWLSVAGGFDASRSIYLFDSMKSIADSLIDKELQEGYRGSLSLRLPFKVMLGFNGTYRVKTANTRDSRTLGGTIRTYDLFGAGIGLGGGYMRILGAYTDGKDVSADADAWISSFLSLNFRLDQYTYQLVVSGDQNKTTTLTGMLNFRISRSWYSMISFDQVWDTIRSTQRLFVELGMQF